MDMNSIDPNNPSYLIIIQGTEEPQTIRIDEDSSYFVGSGNNCGIQIENDDVCQIHCMVLKKDGIVSVQDWNTGSTFVNGQCIDTEMKLQSGDQIEIGQCKMIPVLDRQFHLGIATEILEDPSNVNASSPSRFHTPDLVTNEAARVSEDSTFEEEESIEDSFDLTAEIIDVKLDEDSDSPSHEENLSLQVAVRREESASASNQVAEAEFIKTYLRPDYEIPGIQADSAANNDPFEDPWGSDSESGPKTEFAPEDSETTSNTEPSHLDEKTRKFIYNIDGDYDDDVDVDLPSEFLADPFPESTLSTDSPNEKLLKAEIEQLRFELADRDELIRSLQTKPASRNHEFEEAEQTLKLVGRLEELLEELETSDERIRSLEELLRLSEQANAAEKEERKQLNVWVHEIEDRIATRESESKAEIERLTELLRQSRSEVKHSEDQFTHLIASQQQTDSGISTEANQLIRECRDQIQELKSQLDDANQENADLRKNAISGNIEEFQTENIELKEQLARLEVESAREKAELARKHAEIERLTNDLDEKLITAKKINQGDSRIQAMRQHLREIHEEEQQEKMDQWNQSLSGKILNLLNRSRRN
ncbi:MAG: FHA domain-containing protein [Planctomycetota bacterium]